MNGILFNHESPIRGETFVTRKITRGVAAIELGQQDKLYLGNLDAYRDWGHAEDYVRGMWMMLQQPEPDDYVLATGEAHSVREFVELAFSFVGREIDWSGKVPTRRASAEKLDVCWWRSTGSISARWRSSYLLGDRSKARRKLGWKATISFREMVEKMVLVDLDRHRRGHDKISCTPCGYEESGAVD